MAVILAALLASLLHAAEPDAVRIQQELSDRHLPYGMILDPIFAAPDSDEIVNYTRCGDSAIWTGHYLAALSFRYAVTADPEALALLQAALDGLELLVRITRTGLLARCAFPDSSPYHDMIASEERANGIWQGSVNGEPWTWIGNTSRDQYSGVFFGLNAAWELVPDETVRARVKALVTEMLDYLLDRAWSVTMPDLGISTTFVQRPDQQLSLLRTGSRVNPERFNDTYRRLAGASSGLANLPIAVDLFDLNSSYFKFNLDYIHCWSLLAVGDDDAAVRANYRRAYDALRRATASHVNAHFNMIDRAIRGADNGRDAETRQYLDEWLLRPRRDFPIDWTGQVRACGANRACDPIAVPNRVPTDFLWQRSPFQMSGGGGGFVESAGIDYLLPYWMARYYGVVSE